MKDACYTFTARWQHKLTYIIFNLLKNILHELRPREFQSGLEVTQGSEIHRL